jgi:hypothetical protein
VRYITQNLLYLFRRLIVHGTSDRAGLGEEIPPPGDMGGPLRRFCPCGLGCRGCVRGRGVLGHPRGHGRTGDLETAFGVVLSRVAAGAAPPGRTGPGLGYLRNLLTKVLKSAQPWVASMVRAIFDRPAAEEVAAQHGQGGRQPAPKYLDAPAHLDEARDTRWSSPASPARSGGRSGPTTPRTVARGNPPPHRRGRDLCDRTAIICLIDAVLMESTNTAKVAATWAWNFSPKPACDS